MHRSGSSASDTRVLGDSLQFPIDLTKQLIEPTAYAMTSRARQRQRGSDAVVVHMRRLDHSFISLAQVLNEFRSFVDLAEDGRLHQERFHHESIVKSCSQRRVPARGHNNKDFERFS